jgi:hypothetical protein
MNRIQIIACIHCRSSTISCARLVNNAAHCGKFVSDALAWMRCPCPHAPPVLYQILWRALVCKFKRPEHGATPSRCAIGKDAAICIKNRICVPAHKFRQKASHSDRIITKRHPRFGDDNSHLFALLLHGRFTVWTITDDFHDSQAL